MKIVFAAFLFVMTGSFAQAFAPSNTPVHNPAGKGEEIKVGVQGMDCEHCAKTIEKKFKGMGEVAKVEVNFKGGYMKLTFKAGQKMSNEKIAEALKDAGYQAQF